MSARTAQVRDLLIKFPRNQDAVIFQGCALTAPGRLRRLTFGLGLKIFSWSPGRATGWCWFLDLQSKKKKKMLFNRARVDVLRSFHVNSHVA